MALMISEQRAVSPSMGIRFLCPNGHKLNVKAFLAGKRGICPHCDAKFLVPAESGGQALAIDEPPPVLPRPAMSAPATSPNESPHQSPALAPAVAPPLAMPATADPPPTVDEPPLPEVWYVRTESGEQFGPASTAVMRGWVAEGRVAVDCSVWCTGWPAWKTGGQAITLLNGPPAERTSPRAGQPLLPSADLPAAAPAGGMAGRLAEPTSLPEPTILSEPTSLPASTSLPDPTCATVQYRTARRSRQERARKVTLFLGGVVLLLVAVLVGVLINNQ